MSTFRFLQYLILAFLLENHASPAFTFPDSPTIFVYFVLPDSHETQNIFVYLLVIFFIRSSADPFH